MTEPRALKPGDRIRVRGIFDVLTVEDASDPMFIIARGPRGALFALGRSVCRPATRAPASGKRKAKPKPKARRYVAGRAKERATSNRRRGSTPKIDPERGRLDRRAETDS